jgi:hypothetical protein
MGHNHLTKRTVEGDKGLQAPPKPPLSPKTVIIVDNPISRLETYAIIVSALILLIMIGCVACGVFKKV